MDMLARSSSFCCVQNWHYNASYLQWTTFCVSMDLLASPGHYQADESANLRAQVCAAAGLPEEKAEEAVQQLSSRKPRVLRELVQQHGNFSTQVINAELVAIVEIVGELVGEVKKVHSKLDQLLAHHAMVDARREKQSLLAGYLKDWWTHALGKWANFIQLGTFCEKLLDWFKANK